jgi:tetratricopeptide (TPR) repeat protein
VIGWALASTLGALLAVAPPEEPNGGLRLPTVDDELPPPPDTDGAEDPEAVALRRAEEFEQHLLRAQAAVAKERHDEAVREYSSALRLQPGDPTALLGRAMARRARTAPDRCPTQAISDLRLLESYDPRGWLEHRATLVAWMGACGSSYAADRLLLAKDIANERRGSVGRPDDIRLLVARLQLEAATEDGAAADVAAARTSALLELQRYEEECTKAGSSPSPEGLRMHADLLREQGEIDAAVGMYRRLVDATPQSPHAAGVAKLLRDLEMQRELQRLDETQGFRPTPEAEAAYSRGLAALRVGDVDGALAQFTQATEIAPWFPRAHHALGVTFARTGRFTEAAEALERAIHMEPTDYQAHMTLGLVYKKEFAGAEDEQAIKHLAAALRLRPDLHRLHLLLGELYARAANRERAREHYERFIRVARDGDPDVVRARRAIEDLERELRKDEPLAITPPAEESLRTLPPELQRMINEAHLRGNEYQDLAFAEKILLEAKDRFPNEPVVYNQLATFVFLQDRSGDARQYWEQSLTLKEDQVEVHERLGLLLQNQLPEAAVPHLQRAADLGSSTARFVLAELLWDGGNPWRAAAVLDMYLAEAGDYDLHHERAVELREEVARRLLQIYLAGGLLIALLLAFPTWRLYRRYRGKSLRQLLERDPKSFPEVARILSLIRHEILKHNTAFLADVGRALEFDAPDADARAAVLAERLFGSRDVDARVGSREPSRLPGIHGRFLGYVEELEKVARAHRVRLNLQRKDSIFGPMIASFELLAARAKDLRALHNLRASRRLELARTLTRCGEVLGRQAFDKLSGLIRELCIVNVDGRMVESTYAHVIGEQGFANQRFAPLVVTGTGASIRIFRVDLEDILANVIRNSLRSSLSYARPPVGLAIDLVTEIDEITGLGTLAIRIKDRSPEQLSNEMLRGRYVERGMGITVDLLSRYDGSIAVETDPVWSKAVVLRFFILEGDGSSAAAVAA